MNVPGKPNGNWRWRFTWDQVDAGLASRMNYLCKLYGRS